MNISIASTASVMLPIKSEMLPCVPRKVRPPVDLAYRRLPHAKGASSGFGYGLTVLKEVNKVPNQNGWRTGNQAVIAIPSSCSAPTDGAGWQRPGKWEEG
jgi:hypothetical protein